MHTGGKIIPNISFDLATTLNIFPSDSLKVLINKNMKRILIKSKIVLAFYHPTKTSMQSVKPAPIKANIIKLLIVDSPVLFLVNILIVMKQAKIT